MAMKQTSSFITHLSLSLGIRFCICRGRGRRRGGIVVVVVVGVVFIVARDSAIANTVNVNTAK